MKSPGAVPVLVAALAALLLAGCGGGGSTGGSLSTPSRPPAESAGGPVAPLKKATAPRAPAGSRVVSCAGRGHDVDGLRAAGTDCEAARATMARWQRSSACRLGQGKSRASCSLGVYRCQAIDVDRGTAVSCARGDGSDISFLARRRPQS